MTVQIAGVQAAAEQAFIWGIDPCQALALMGPNGVSGDAAKGGGEFWLTGAAQGFDVII